MNGPGQPPPDPKPYELRALDPATTHFTLDAEGQLFMRGAGVEAPRLVRAMRCFPLTEPSQCVSIQDAAVSDGVELGLVEEPSLLAPADRRALARALERRYIVARIQQILALTEEYGHLKFTVVTDRGERTFYVVNAHEAVIPVSGTRRIELEDVDGARFEIPDLDALPASDRRLVEQRLYL